MPDRSYILLSCAIGSLCCCVSLFIRITTRLSCNTRLHCISMFGHRFGRLTVREKKCHYFYGLLLFLNMKAKAKWHLWSAPPLLQPSDPKLLNILCIRAPYNSIANDIYITEIHNHMSNKKYISNELLQISENGFFSIKIKIIFNSLHSFLWNYCPNLWLSSGLKFLVKP